MKLTRYGPACVIAGYTLLLAFTTGLPVAGGNLQASVRGTVTNAVTGASLPKAWVRLVPVPDATKVRPAVTDDEGQFIFEDLPPGSYSLEAEHQGFMDRSYGDVAGARFELKLAAGQNLSGLNIELLPPAAIAGRVRDEDGDPWIHAVVSIYHARWEQGKRQLAGFTGGSR